MDWHRRVRDAFNAARVRPPAPDVLEELAQHAESVFNGARADGHSPATADALVAALIARWVNESGTLEHRERRPPAIAPPAPESRGSVAGALADIAHDALYAFRLLRRQPRFAMLVILTM